MAAAQRAITHLRTFRPARTGVSYSDIRGSMQRHEFANDTIVVDEFADGSRHDGTAPTSGVAIIARLTQKSLQHSCFAIFCMSPGEALSSPWTWLPFVMSWWSSDGTVVDVAIDPCIAAEAAGNEYPASDAMITKRNRTSIFADVIRYISIPEDYHQSGSCQLRASSSR